MKYICTLLFLFLLIYTALAQEPTISGIYPSSALPGSTVTITGSNFLGTTSVSVFGQESQFTVVNLNTISFKVPIKYSGPDKVKVISPNGIGEKSFYVNIPPDPTITGFSPSTVMRGNTVTITGTNLSYVHTIGIGGMEWEKGFVINSNSSISFKIPNDAISTSGALMLKSASNFAISQNLLTVQDDPKPSISAIAPLTGKIGSSVTITGTNLLSTLVVFFDQIPTNNFVINSSTSITVVVPDGAQTCQIGVGNASEVVYGTSIFTPQSAGAPTIISFSPSSGTPGTLCTITGSNIIAESMVLLNGTPVNDYTWNSSSSVIFKVPVGAGSGLLSVVNSGGIAQSATSFNVVLPPAPTISSISSTTVQSGSTITISGINFTGLYRVSYNGIDCEIIDFSPTSIVVKVIAGGTGAIEVSAFGGTAISTAILTVTAPAVPTITSFTPSSGYYNQPITITGTNLASVSSIYFGSDMVFDFVVNSPTSITAKVPFGEASGRISLTTLGGGTESAEVFTKIFESAPTFNSFSPSSGPVGTKVTITGSNFLSMGAIEFGGIFIQDFVINSATSLSIRVPEGSTSGKIKLLSESSPGAIHEVQSATDFTITPKSAPTITSLTPTTASVGSTITINGTNFLPTYYLVFKDINVTDFTVNSSSSITAVVPTGATTGKIGVVTAEGTAVSSANLTIVVSAAPTISSFNPTSGAVGSTVTITGTNFTGASSVKFNNVSAISFSVVSSTSITAVVPAGATTGKVTITTAGGTAVSASDFTLLILAPVISSFTPGTANVGTTVTISGSNFTGVTSVKFNNISASFTVVSASSIRAIVPEGAMTGKISVTTSAGSALSGSDFKVSVPVVTLGSAELVKDIIPGDVAGSPINLTSCGGTLFFFAQDRSLVSGETELWKSDGTASGTVMIKDINPNKGAIQSNTSLVCMMGNVYFIADDGIHGIELWKSDGTADGTVMVKDIQANAIGSRPDHLTVMNDKLYFAADDGINGNELWKTDGTSSGTVMVKDIRAESNYSSFNSNSYGILAFNNQLFFSAQDAIPHGNELWKSDGTNAGTVLVKEINTNYGSYPDNIIEYKGEIYFTAEDDVHGEELWKSDGTPGGTVLVKDIRPGSSDSYSGSYKVANGLLFFIAYDGVHGGELWKTDGTDLGTKMVKDIRAGASDGLGDGANFVEFNGNLYFGATDGATNNGTYTLWKSNGTEEGTVIVKPIAISGREFLVMNSVLFFAGNDGAHGFELWKSDGTTSGTTMVQDIFPAGITLGSHANPVDFCIHNNELYFRADDGVHGLELWKLGTSTVGITDQTSSNSLFNIYPNPVKDQLLISSKNNTKFNNDEVMVMDITRKVIIRKVINGSIDSISTEQLPSGIYFVNIGGSTFKIIKE
ncbi:MAG: IPT/TIG domain-containing protein [Sporocytophaga sp.]|uniref:ELWxxDGT repeat protein n=1 Tax=Sporocytophaga sp. TaxID=2231183 RepID=UPI001B0CE3F4|nr:ELWxxDGT repeat protein [Sporocytophaga sp.]MBO9703331.1 IPT/TIG domain-containing protein [Sporocytophaga sp.]